MKHIEIQSILGGKNQARIRTPFGVANLKASLEIAKSIGPAKREAIALQAPAIIYRDSIDRLEKTFTPHSPIAVYKVPWLFLVKLNPNGFAQFLSFPSSAQKLPPKM